MPRPEVQIKLPKQFALVTNVENDHMDYYNTIENMLNCYIEFLDSIPKNSFAVVCIDDKYNRFLLKKTTSKIITYGIDKEAAYIATDIKKKGMITEFSIFAYGKYIGRTEIQIPGKHNILNALGAGAMSIEVGISFEKFSRAMKKFKTPNRRFEIKGIEKGIMIVDDYAHHPTEITATLAAAKEINAKRIVCIFQPHRYSRTQILKKEFGNCFNEADLVMFTDIYAASEKPIDGINGQTIVAEYEKNTKKKAIYIMDFENLAIFVEPYLKKGDIVLTIGAGSITYVGEKLLKILRKVR